MYTRPDGRSSTELRDISITFDGLDGVDGSARFGFGQTKALCSVSGPIEVRLAAEQASRATFEVIVRPLAGFPGTESKALGAALRSALLPGMVLTANPRTLVQLVAQSLTPPFSSNAYSSPRPMNSNTTFARADPALVAATINAATLALLNASSVPLRGVVCASAIGRVHESNELIVDPAENERDKLDGGGVFAFLIGGTRLGTTTQDIQNAVIGEDVQAEVVWTNWGATGGKAFDEDELRRATELARAGALCIWGHMKTAISRLVLGTDDLAVPGLKQEGKEAVLDDAKMEIS